MLVDELITLCVKVEILFSRKGSRSNSGAGGRGAALCALKLSLNTSLTFQAEFDKQRIHLNSQFPGTERLPNTCNFSIRGPQLQGEELSWPPCGAGGARGSRAAPRDEARVGVAASCSPCLGSSP